MSAINLETTIARNPKLVQSEIDGEVVMMSIEDGAYYGMDLVGSRIWALLDTPSDIRNLCRQLVTIYEVDESQCTSDVLAFVSDLLEHNVVQILS